VESSNVADSFTSVAWFTVQDGRHADFESAFHDSGMLTRPEIIDGYLGARLFRSTDDSRQYCVIGQWTSIAAYEEWQQMASRGAPQEALARLSDSIESNRLGVLFEGPIQ
jgi:heme-degrading monooxygenase HmoA